MLSLTRLASEITKLEQAANAADSAGYRDLFLELWDRRNAFVRVATYIQPRDPDEVIMLQGIQRELLEFVDDEPTREADRDDAIAALHRMTESIRDFAIGA